ncbi:MAG: type IV secretory system conjugative DNA transfer family protein, partial [Pseudomonadota bacterium]
MSIPDNALNRFGSAVTASYQDISRAGFFTQHPNSLFIGFFGNRPRWYSGAGGLSIVAGARGGKLRDLLAYNICSGIYLLTMLILDMKGELAAISQKQTADRKYCIYWNPLRLHGLPYHRINPLDYIRIDSPSLISDIKVLCLNLIPDSGSPNGAFFESRAREVLEGIMVALTKQNGVLTFPDLYHVINLIPGGGDDWLNFAFEMSECGYPLSVRVEEEIAESRDDHTGGFKGILGEVFRAVAPLSDPVLMDAVSPPFDFSLGDPCCGDQAYQVYLMPPAEFVEAWAPILKSIFVGAMIWKARAPGAPQQTWILDECAQLGRFPLVPKMFTYGAGIGIRPVAVYQSADQMKATGPNADTIIPSSAACQLWFAIRDLASATSVSRMLGAQTLEYDDPAAQARARHAKQQALQALLNGDDPFSAGLSYKHHREEAERPSKQHRLLRTPDEVLNTPGDRAYVFVDGLGKPIYADRKPYSDQRFMAGR